jgi:LmbE family N-acetylglucosaminyl deacetylase
MQAGVRFMKVLVVVAHPDDEVLGCGGTIANFAQENDIYTLFLGEGVTSRDIPEEQKKQVVSQLKREAEDANKRLNVKKVFFENFPDNRFDTTPLLDIVKVIEGYVQKIGPEVVYTHHAGDLNIDHQIVYRAVITAARPVGDYAVKKIMSFEVLSSSEWGRLNSYSSFVPNVYVDIYETISVKLEAMRCYKSEIRKYPHPRSLEGIKILAQKRGLEVGLRFAEAFSLVRSVE